MMVGAAVGDVDDIVGEHRRQPGDVALEDRRQERIGQLPDLVGGGVRRGRPSRTLSRARRAIWRVAASLRSTATAISANGTANTSWRRKTARSVGSSVSSTRRNPRVSESDDATTSAGSADGARIGRGRHRLGHPRPDVQLAARPGPSSASRWQPGSSRSSATPRRCRWLPDRSAASGSTPPAPRHRRRRESRSFCTRVP